MKLLGLVNFSISLCNSCKIELSLSSRSDSLLSQKIALMKKDPSKLAGTLSLLEIFGDMIHL